MGPVRQEGSSGTSTATDFKFRAVLTEEWQRFLQMTTNRLVASMQRRCVALTNSRGGFTRY